MEARVQAYHCTLLSFPVRLLPGPECVSVCLQSSRGALQESYLDGPASWDEVDTEELERIAVNILRSVVPSTENLEVGARLAMQVGPAKLVHPMRTRSKFICGGKRPASLYLRQSNHMRHGQFHLPMPHAKWPICCSEHHDRSCVFLLLQAAAMGAENLDPLGLGRIDTRQLALVS